MVKNASKSTEMKIDTKFLLQKLCWSPEFNSQGDQDGNWLKLENISQHFQVWKEYIPKIHPLALIAFPGKIHLIFYFQFKCNAVGLGTSFLFQPVMTWNQKSNCPLKRSQKLSCERFSHRWKNIRLRTMNFLAHNKQLSTLKWKQ